MEKHHTEFTIQKMATILEVSRSNYYRHLSKEESNRSKENKRLTEKIKLIHQESSKRYGSPRIHAELKAQHVRCSRKRVASLMQKADVYAKMHKKRKRTTNTSKDKKWVMPNHLKQNFRVEAPNKVWVSDITYIRTKEGWLYLSIVLDLFSRKIVGVAMDNKLEARIVIKSFQQALIHRKPCKGLLHHSDRGVQYTSNGFQEIANRNRVKLSMSDKGHCYDNAVAESFFHTLKSELVDCFCYKTREEAANSIFEYIEAFYNRKRRHSTLGYISPVEFEKMYKEKTKSMDS